MMNKKAQSGGMLVWGFFGMMIGLMLWIAYTQMAGPLNDATQDARAVTGLDCTNTSISTGTKATCVIVDFMGFGWAGAIITMIFGALAGAIIKKTVTQ